MDPINTNNYYHIIPPKKDESCDDPFSPLHNHLEGIFLSPYYDHHKMVDIQCQGHVKQTTGGSLEDIYHVSKITLPLPPQTLYLKIS